MQTRTWTLKLADGRSYEGLSQEDATIALARLIHGVEPVAERRAKVARAIDEHELPLAA